MAEHRFSNLYNKQHFSLLWYSYKHFSPFSRFPFYDMFFGTMNFFAERIDSEYRNSDIKISPNIAQTSSRGGLVVEPLLWWIESRLRKVIIYGNLTRPHSLRMEVGVSMSCYMNTYYDMCYKIWDSVYIYLKYITLLKQRNIDHRW